MTGLRVCLPDVDENTLYDLCYTLHLKEDPNHRYWNFSKGNKHVRRLKQKFIAILRHEYSNYDSILMATEPKNRKNTRKTLHEEFEAQALEKYPFLRH